MNEPMSPGVSLETLIRYYQMGYNTVRKYTSSAYVVLSNRLGPANSKELLSFAGSLSNVVVEVHYYNLYSDSYRRMNVQQNINFIYHQRSSDLSALSVPNGPLSFVGKWFRNCHIIWSWQLGDIWLIKSGTYNIKVS